MSTIAFVRNFIAAILIFYFWEICATLQRLVIFITDSNSLRKASFLGEFARLSTRLHTTKYHQKFSRETFKDDIVGKTEQGN